jgi:hypothetical protein
MNLPNFFLADLPPETVLDAAVISEACQTLKRNREQYLRGRSTASLVQLFAELASSWLSPEYPFRKLALGADPAQTGFSPQTLRRGLDSFFQEITAEKLETLLALELGTSRRLDEFCAPLLEQKAGRCGLARGPELLAHIAGGTLPTPSFLSIILGLLVRSAQFVKCASGASLLTRLFAHSLYEVEPKLGACLEIAAWPGGREDLEDALFQAVDCLTVTGSDETLAHVRKRVPPHVRCLAYGHRVSFGYITHEALSSYNAARIAERAAADVTAWNQRGCLSPHLFYVERGGRVSDEDFAQMLAAALERFEQSEPRGLIPEAAAADIASRRAFYEIRAAHSPDTRQWRSENSTAWTVVYEADPRFQLSCLNRFVYVKGVANISKALQAADPVRGRVSTVGVAAAEQHLQELATAFAHWGVTRVCPIGRMQDPPLSWRHDGRPPLGDLVLWTDWEQPE